MLRPFLRSLVVVLLVLAGVAAAFAQSPIGSFNGGWIFCENPVTPHTVDFNFLSITEVAEFTGLGAADDSPLMWTEVGERGAASWVCFQPNTWSVNVPGRFGFEVGTNGTVQTLEDDFMALTFGMPIDSGNSFCYAVIKQDAGTNLFGTAPVTPLFFRGVSDRYIKYEQAFAESDVLLSVDVIGDAARYDWLITNKKTVQSKIGLWQGAWIGLLDNNGEARGFLEGVISTSKVFLSIPGQKTPDLETIWTRKDNPAVYPPTMDVDWSQSQVYGLRVELGPTDATTDPVTGISDATQSDVFTLAIHGDGEAGNGLLGKMTDPQPTAYDQLFPITHTDQPGIQQSDLPFQQDPGYLIKFDQTPVAAGATREIVQYFRSTWGQSNYAPPYSIILDAPKVINYDPLGQNQLTPNPSTFKVWIDNTRGFSTAEQTIPLQNVRVTLDLSQAPALSFAGGGKTQTLTIAQIDSRRMKAVSFQVIADGVHSGTQPLLISVTAPPGPVKTLSAITTVSTTPKIPVVPGSNLVAFPWQFTNSSLDAVLGLTQPTNYQAFVWDPAQQGYVLATSAQRGIGTWLVINDPSVIPQGFVTLNSNPTLPPDMQTGAGSIALSQGWNLIADPYPYPFPLGDLIGVPAGDPQHTYKWVNLVSAGFVSQSMAYWDTTANPPSYKFISGTDALMQPNLGYWVFVSDLGLTLEFPPIFLEGANTAGGGAAAIRTRSVATPFAQSASQYRLMLAARTTDEIDDQNFVGKAATADAAKTLKIYEPPMGPKQTLGVSIGGDTPTSTRLAQSLIASTGPLKWTVYVDTKKANQVTMTWPNMSKVPKNVMFKLTDTATGTTRDMRRTSGYTFQADANTTRAFTVEATQGVASRAIIGNVIVSQPGRSRDPNAAFTISYTLSASATTTVRILGAGGREVYTATRGRADSAGENTATWALRDNANRAVAPGIYRVEIMAETSDGQRVRKIVPVNVIR